MTIYNHEILYLLVRVQLCLAMQIYFLQFCFFGGELYSYISRVGIGTPPANPRQRQIAQFLLLPSAPAYVTDPTTRGFELSRLLLHCFFSLKLDATGCLNNYRCSRTNWDQYTLHQAHFFPARQSIKNLGAAGAGRFMDE